MNNEKQNELTSPSNINENKQDYLQESSKINNTNENEDDNENLNIIMNAQKEVLANIEKNQYLHNENANDNLMKDLKNKYEKPIINDVDEEKINNEKNNLSEEEDNNEMKESSIEQKQNINNNEEVILDTQDINPNTIEKIPLNQSINENSQEFGISNTLTNDEKRKEKKGKTSIDNTNLQKQFSPIDIFTKYEQEAKENSLNINKKFKKKNRNSNILPEKSIYKK